MKKTNDYRGHIPSTASELEEDYAELREEYERLRAENIRLRGESGMTDAGRGLAVATFFLALAVGVGLAADRYFAGGSKVILFVAATLLLALGLIASLSASDGTRFWK